MPENSPPPHPADTWEIRATFGERSRPVSHLAASPSGRFLVFVYGLAESPYSTQIEGATLFRRMEDTFFPIGDLPVASGEILVLDRGECIVVRADHQAVEFVRCLPRADWSGVEIATRWEPLTGLGLSAPELGLLPPGREVIVGAQDRDDGHGWSEPVYTWAWRRVDLPTGRTVQESESLGGLGYLHLRRSAGQRWVLPQQTGIDEEDLGRIRKILQKLAATMQRPLCVGRKYVLSTREVIAIATGATVLGGLRQDHRPAREFFDLSEDERWALAVDAGGQMELWDLTTGAEQKMPPAEGAPTRAKCGAFLSRTEAVVGMDNGKGALLRMK